MFHFIDDRDLDRERRLALLESAWDAKHGSRSLERKKPLNGRHLAMVMTKPSLRTRVSFTAAVHKLGGHIVEVGPQNTKLGRGESMEEWAAVLGAMVDVIAARVHEHAWLHELRRYAGVPIVNALSDDLHPCQAIADAFTVWENARLLHHAQSETPAMYYAQPHRWTWVGDGNNVAHSLMLTCAWLGVQLILCTPPGCEVQAKYLEAARGMHPAGERGIMIEADPRVAVQGSAAVYTDTWISMGEEAQKLAGGESELERVFGRYRVDRALMSQARPDAIFMHCLPAEPGREVTAEVLRGPQSRVIVGAENRLWTTLALLGSAVAGSFEMHG